MKRYCNQGHPVPDKNHQEWRKEMRKSNIIAMVVLLTTVFTGCAAKPADKAEDNARKFVDTYYAQYEKKEEIEKIWEDFSNTPSTALPPYNENDPIFDEMREYIDETYEGMVSTKGRDTLVANRILFNTDVLVNPVIRCEVTSVTFKEKSNEVNGLTYEFVAKVTETNPDQTKTEKEVPGMIRMLDENGKWMVDGFKLDS